MAIDKKLLEKLAVRREKVLAAGCVGYIVSIVGRRAVYFGRSAETHVELFPSGK